MLFITNTEPGRADCGHADPNPYAVCPWTGQPRLTTLCRACYEDACRRARRDENEAGALRRRGERGRKGRHVSNAA